MDHETSVRCLNQLREAAICLEEADYAILALRVTAIVDLIEDELASKRESALEETTESRH